MADMQHGKKRRQDQLASLDAAFAVQESKAKATLYTKNAAAQGRPAQALQAYQHTKRRRTQPSQNGQGQLAAGSLNHVGGENAVTSAPKVTYDRFYGRLDVETLKVGLQHCSLQAKVPTLRSARACNAVLKQHFDTLLGAPNGNVTVTEKLKSRVLQFDNPIKTTGAVKSKHVTGAVQAQFVKMMSARQRRKQELQLLTEPIAFEAAEQLSQLWKRYAMEVFGADIFTNGTDMAKSSRLVTKLRSMDLCGCPIQVVQSNHPHNIGITGIIVSDKANVFQVCSPRHLRLLMLVKHESRFLVRFDDQHAFTVSGSLLAKRQMT